MKWTLPIFIFILAASAILYTYFLDSSYIGWFGNAFQLAGLLLGALNLNIARKSYQPGDQPRNAWTWLTAGIVLWSIAQIMDAYHEIILQEIPYGTISDAFWVLGYIPLLLGMITLIRSFLSTGLPAGSRLSYLLIAIIFSAVYIVFLITIILPDLNDPESSYAARFLDVVYPALDVVLIALAVGLVRISWVLRGGNLAKAWLLLCIGFALVAAADLVLGGITDIDSGSYRFLDVLYFLAYFSIALAGRIQVRILKNV